MCQPSISLASRDAHDSLARCARSVSLSGNPGFSAGCVDSVGGLDSIFGNPSQFSVAIATSDSPNGAARGQLARSG
jgi:hypothetical protein